MAPAPFYVTNRTYERAVALAQKFNGEAIPVRAALRNRATGRHRHQLHRRAAPHLPPSEHGERFLAPPPQPSHVLHRYRRAARRRSRDEQAGRHLRLRHRRSAAGGRARTSPIAAREADRAEAIVQPEVERFQGAPADRWTWCRPSSRCRSTSRPSARPRSTACVAGWAHSRPEQELAVEALTRGIINKIMHTPITTLKSGGPRARRSHHGHRPGAPAVQLARRQGCRGQGAKGEGEQQPRGRR